MTPDRTVPEITASEVSTRSVRGDVVEIAVRGELDMRSGRLVREALETCFDDDAIQTLSLHLGDATFIDSSGLRVLIRARRAARMTDRALVLTSPSHAVVRLLQVTGMDKLFDVVHG